MTTPSGLGSRTTAEQALRGASLTGKVAIVTGANSGIGTETARVLALAGADVVMCSRSIAAGEEVAKRLRASLPAGAGSLEVCALDLADLASVRAFAEAFLATKRPLDLLINNAGIMATPLGKTAQGSELQVGTNHIGHFLLTKLLRPAIESSPSARIVNVSSALHKRGKGDRLLETLDRDPGYARRKYVPFEAYGDSKLANVLFTRQLVKELPATVKAFAVHPGVIMTNLTRSMGILGSAFRLVGGAFTKSIPQGAATTVYAATAPELQSGVYLADCEVQRPSRAASDDTFAKKLWDVSETLVSNA